MSEEYLLASGWKDVSLVDIKSNVSFTLWLCGCNLSCPFCHNWRIAEASTEECKPTDINKILYAVKKTQRLIDYFHITGGEPLIQYRKLIILLRKLREETDVKISINSNLTMTTILEKILKANLVDHLATDLKIPFCEMTGTKNHACNRLEINYFRSIKTIGKYKTPLELRIPVPKNIKKYQEKVISTIRLLTSILRNNHWYIVINPLVGHPYTEPRDKQWCTEHCNPAKEDVLKLEKSIREIVEPYGVKIKLVIR